MIHIWNNILTENPDLHMRNLSCGARCNENKENEIFRQYIEPYFWDGEE